MKRLILLIFLVLFTCDNKGHEYRVEQQVYDIVQATKSGNYLRKTISIMEYSHIYSDEKAYIDPIMLARLGDAESDHRHYLINKSSGCLGTYQINPVHWTHLLFYVDNGNLGKYLLKNNIPKSNYNKYFLRIGYNVEAACIILRDYKIRYKTWTNALTVYGGFRTKWGKANPERRDRYLAKVLGK